MQSQLSSAFISEGFASFFDCPAEVVHCHLGGLLTCLGPVFHNNVVRELVKVNLLDTGLACRHETNRWHVPSTGSCILI